MNEDLIKVINRLQDNINSVPLILSNYPEGELKRKPAPNKWSKQEILGHLIDSAANNHHRFVKAQFEEQPFHLGKYAQDDWVRVQNYNGADSSFLIALWKVYNEHILHIMKQTPEANLKINCIADDPFENADNLFLLMKDYVDHMDHHLKQIFI